jgi:hypothetical protein
MGAHWELAGEEGEGGEGEVQGVRLGGGGAAREAGAPGWLPAALLVREGRKERFVRWPLFA